VNRRPETDIVVLLVSLAMAVTPLAPVFGAGVLVLPVTAGLLLGAVVALLSARLRWGTAVTMVAALVGFLLLGSAVAVRSEALMGFLPSARSLVALLSGAVTSWKQVLTLDPELGSVGNTLVAPFLLTLVGALGAVSLALRVRVARGATAAVIPVAVLGVSVLLGTKVAVAPAPIGIALVLSLGTWAAWRAGALAPRRVGSLVLVAVVVIGLGSVTGPWVAEQRPRYVLRDEIVPPFSAADQASPLSAFRKFVKDWGDTPLLTVRGLPDGATVRLATMDAFDGVVWNVAGAEAADGSGSFRRVGSAVDTLNRSGRRATVEFEVHDLPFVWLPTVGWSKQIDFTGSDLRAELRYNDATGTAALVDGVPDGLRWTAQVVVPQAPDEAQLDSAAIGQVALPAPRDVPDVVTQFASQRAGTAGSPGLIARTLETDLATTGFFSHGLTDRGEAPSLSGHGAFRIAILLSSMVGDGEQYASAMALMAREMGLPARVVLGFVPSPDAAGEKEITFTGSDIQAWVEINFAGYGWVSFFPTPDESRTTRQDTSKDVSAAQPQVRQPPPPPQAPVNAPDDDTEQPRTADNQEQSRSSHLWRTIGQVALVGGVPLVALLGPPGLVLLLKRRRRSRRLRADGGVRRVVGGWDELLDQAADLRRPLPPQATRRELAVALSGSFGRRPSRTPVPGRRAVGIGGPVATLAARADAVVFGGQEPSAAEVEAYWAQVDSTMQAMRRAVPRRVRWGSRWSPVSLRRAARRRHGRSV
jgi:transglutaminase-like putative cysteine protease